MGPKKPTKVPGYLITFYKCPYCKNVFLGNAIKAHVRVCYKKYRAKVSEACRERALKNFAEGKILKHVRRPDNGGQ